MDGIYRIRIWRDEEYMLRAEASGQYKKREDGEKPEHGMVARSTLKGWWNHSYEAKLVQCIPENTTTNYLLWEDRTEVACKMSVCKIKVKPAKGAPKQERVSFVEWCINAPASTVLYVESTERKVRTKLCKKRDRSKDTYQPHREEAFSREPGATSAGCRRNMIRSGARSCQSSIVMHLAVCRIRKRVRQCGNWQAF